MTDRQSAGFTGGLFIHEHTNNWATRGSVTGDNKSHTVPLKGMLPGTLPATVPLLHGCPGASNSPSNTQIQPDAKHQTCSFPPGPVLGDMGSWLQVTINKFNCKGH